jgi:hypothetical protein
MKEFIENNKTIIKIFENIFGTLIFFCAFFFIDKEFSFATIIANLKNPTLYICLFFSFLASLFISKMINRKIKSP